MRKFNILEKKSGLDWVPVGYLQASPSDILRMRDPVTLEILDQGSKCENFRLTKPVEKTTDNYLLSVVPVVI